MQLLPAMSLCLLRPLGAFLLIPIFSSSNLGGVLIRNALLLVISVPLLPVYPQWPLPSAGIWGYILLITGEICIGLVIGFCAAIPFWALDMAGFLIDTLRGSSMASVLNPLLGGQSSLFGLLFTQVFSVLFLMGGGFNELLTALYKSYDILPPGGILRFSSVALTFISQQWQLVYELFLRFSMPAMVVILLVDMAMGLINRSAQQLNVFFLAMPIKSAFVLLMLIISFSFAFGSLLKHSLSFSDLSQVLLEAFL